MLRSDPRLPRPLRLAWRASCILAGAYFLLLAARWVAGADVLPTDLHVAIQLLLLAAAAGLVLARGLALREGRTTWLLLAAGFGAWTLGALVAAVQVSGAERPFPSAIDAGLLVYYLAQYVGLCLLARSTLRRVSRAAWLDGAIVVGLIGAVGAHWLFSPLAHADGTSTGAAVVTIVYSACDVALLAVVLVVAALSGGRPGGTWWTLGGGALLTGVAHAIFTMQSMGGIVPDTTTGPLTIPYGLGGLLVVAAAMSPPSRSRGRDLMGWRALAGPLVGSVAVLALLVYDSTAELVGAAEILMAVVVGLILVRAILAFRENIQLADSHRQARTDELTGLPNRRSAYAELDERCRRDEAVAVLMIDLDRFKDLNDTLGHLAGDEALVAVAGRLRSTVGDAARVSRLGGDEFAVVLTPGAGDDDAVVIARRLLDALDEPLYLENLLLPIRASIGIASFASGRDGSREELLRHADVAMYHAKSTGSGVEVYSPGRDANSRERLELASELQDAITGGQIVLHFQPKACLRTGAIVGVEALARWVHPVRGMIPPAEFVPLVERAGLGRVLTLKVVAQALRAERAWRAAGVEVPVAVNTSASTLLDLRFPDDIAELLERSDAPPGVLSLELTEETIMTDPGRAQDVLARLSELGIELSLDDFGTGYSSLSMLKRLPVRELKIDRSFVMDMLDDPGDAAIVRSTVDLARNLGLRVVAEGVESEAAWQLLAEWGCDFAQGYHLSRPVPETDLAALLQASPA
jgi:diguanylate cyclase (GGDEF)-like protein